MLARCDQLCLNSPSFQRFSASLLVIFSNSPKEVGSMILHVIGQGAKSHVLLALIPNTPHTDIGQFGPTTLVTQNLMADSARNEVSWQSAFWALVPIAINSMTQPCGKIYGFSEDYGFFLRSSPIICAYDAISTLVLFGFRLIEGKSFRKASQAVISYRFRHTNEEIGSGGLQDLQNNTRLRLFLFAAGALPQLIKIYAFAGVHWTKVWASLFFVSFGLLEVLVVSQRKPLVPLKSKPPGHSDSDQIFTYDDFMAVFHCVLSIIYMSCCVAITRLVNLATPLALPLWIVIQSSAIWVIGNITTSKEPRDAIQASLMAFLQTNFLLVGHLTLLESHKIIKLLCFTCSHCIFALVPETSWQFWTWLQRKHSNTFRFLNTVSKSYIVLLNFSFGLTCYSLLYDPAGTVKSKWTENLG